MKTSFAAISDIHENYPDQPARADALLIAGDCFAIKSFMHKQENLHAELIRQERELDRLVEFILDVEVKQVVIIAGNHDYLFEILGPELVNYALNHRARKAANLRKMDPPEIVYLENSGFEFQGHQIWGTPHAAKIKESPWPRSTSFVLDEEDYLANFKLQPADIILTHNSPNLNGKEPPDSLPASDKLAEEIKRVKPQVVICGHYHWMRGEYQWPGTKLLSSSRTKPYDRDNLEDDTVEFYQDAPYFYFELE
jgi:Icc-related predicted phosphoesterase